MQWTDQIRRVKIILVLAAVVIAVVSLVVSHFLIRDLASEERGKMEVWAEAMRTLNNADENTDINLVLRVINSNNTIPVWCSTRTDRYRLAATLKLNIAKTLPIPPLFLMIWASNCLPPTAISALHSTTTAATTILTSVTTIRSCCAAWRHTPIYN